MAESKQSTDTKATVSVAKPENWRVGLRSTLEQQGYILKHGVMSDCTLTVGPHDGPTQQFRAHRLILSLKSRVIEAMFGSEMSEGRSGDVRVTDIAPRTFQLMLRHVYTDNVELAKDADGDEDALELLLAAHKYEMEPLVTLSAEHLAVNLQPAVVWRALHTAQLIDCKLVIATCVQLLQSRTMGCLSSPDFLSVPEDSLSLLLAQDILSASEQQLISSVERWARREAMRRTLGEGDAGVRAVLAPRLQFQLRFLTLNLNEFNTGPGLGDWLSEEHKVAIRTSLMNKPGSEQIRRRT